MHIIVDGYNVIRQSAELKYAERQSLESGRNALLHLLAPYQRRKEHSITVVFDGWEGGSPNEERDRFDGVHIIYSPLGEKADEIIKRMLSRHEREVIVVSSDRGVALFAAHRGYGAISSADFEKRLRAVPQAAQETSVERIFENENESGDEEEHGDRIGTRKKGPARKLSRIKRRERQVLERL